jgi:hypothetical protein
VKIRKGKNSKVRVKSRRARFDDPKDGVLKRASYQRVRGFGKGVHRPGSENPKKGSEFNRASGK